MRHLFFILFLLVTYNIFCENDFRNVKWGMTKDEVQKSETAEMNNDNKHKSTLEYKVNLNGDLLKLEYLFDASNDKLFGGDYNETFDIIYVKGYKTFKQFFIKYKNLLDSKYGKSSFPDKNVDYFLCYDLKTGELKSNINNDFENYIIPEENIPKSQLYEDSENRLIQQIIDNGFSYCIKYKTKTTTIILWVNEVSRNIMYIQNEYYAKLNEGFKQKILEIKKKSMEGL